MKIENEIVDTTTLNNFNTKELLDFIKDIPDSKISYSGFSGYPGEWVGSEGKMTSEKRNALRDVEGLPSYFHYHEGLPSLRVSIETVKIINSIKRS